MQSSCGVSNSKENTPIKSYCTYKSGKRDSICSGCSGFLVPQILRHWNAVFQLLPYKCQSPRLWDTLLLNPAHTPPTIWSLFVMYAKIWHPLWIRRTQIDIHHWHSYTITVSTAPGYLEKSLGFSLPHFTTNFHPRHNLSSFFKGLGDCCLWGCCARREAGSTRWMMFPRVCSGQLINTSSSCKILKFQKKTHYKMHPQLSHRDVEDSASRWLRKHHLPSDFWGFYFGRNHHHLYPNRSLLSLPSFDTSWHPACHLFTLHQRKRGMFPFCNRASTYLNGCRISFFQGISSELLWGRNWGRNWGRVTHQDHH